MKKSIINSIIVIASLLFTYGLLEVLFRIFGLGGGVCMRPDPILGTMFIPGAKYRQSIEGFSEGKINSRGLREYEYSYAKPDNTYRIVILGDSFTEAFQVALDSTYHQILERSLNAKNKMKKYEVIALGKSGMGTLEEVLWYQMEGRNFHPDLVLCAFYLGNDFRDNSRELSSRRGSLDTKPFLLEDNTIDRRFIKEKTFRFRAAITPLMRCSRVLTFLMRTIEKIRKGNRSNGSIQEFPVDLYVYRAHCDSAWTRAAEITARLLHTFCSEVKKDSAQFIVVGIPDSYQFYRTIPNVHYSSISADLDFNKPDSLLATMACASGFRYFSLSPCFKTAFERTGLFYYGFGNLLGTGHWNERGHAVAAQCIQNELQNDIPQ